MYLLWIILMSADAVNNAAGYGFLGIDENGKPSWDLVSNLNIVGIEVTSDCQSLPFMHVHTSTESESSPTGWYSISDSNQFQNVHRQLEHPNWSLA